MEQQLTEEELQHQSLLRSIQVLLSGPHGKSFIKYLLESFDFAEVVPVGLYGDRLLDYIGHQRAGVSIYQICLEADPVLTGQLIAEMKTHKERKNVLEDRKTETKSNQR